MTTTELRKALVYSAKALLRDQDNEVPGTGPHHYLEGQIVGIVKAIAIFDEKSYVEDILFGLEKAELGTDDDPLFSILEEVDYR